MNIRWYTYIFLLKFLVFICFQVNGQNLIKDASFENVSVSDCERPDIASSKLVDWYVLDHTPDLFEASCEFNDEDFIFWGNDIEAYDGQNYIGLWSRWNSNNSYFTEGIATKLSEPLQANQPYLFEFMLINRGSFQGLESFGGCRLEPSKHIDLYLATDSISIENNFSDGTATTVATRATVIDSEVIAGNETMSWTKVSACFTALGGEEHFGIILPLGTFGELPPCAETMGTSGLFRSFYYAIDNVSVKELAVELNQNFSYCESQPIDIDLIELFGSTLLETADFLWSDGSTDAIRQFDTVSDTIIITAELDCGLIPLTIQTVSEDCSVNYFVPNVFSPNRDQLNDTFKVQGIEANDVSFFEFSIFDRWGNALFTSNDPSLGWQPENAQSGTYAWILTIEIPGVSQSIVERHSGDLLLIR